MKVPFAPTASEMANLAATLKPELTCDWLSPRGPSDGGIITSFARVPEGRSDALRVLAAEFTNSDEHRSAVVGTAFVVGAVWLDNRMANGYLDGVQASAS